MPEPWIQTVSAVPFDLLAPTADMVRIDDIAYALSRISRLGGHTLGEPYSVAHHSMLVADLLASWGAPPAVVREGLLHDAPEAHYGDTVSPVQRAARDLIKLRLLDLFASEVLAWGEGASVPSLWSGGAVFAGESAVASIDQLARELDPLRLLRERVDPVVRMALALPSDETPIVKRADLVALAIERRDLMAPCERDWLLPEYAPDPAPCGALHGDRGDAPPPAWRDRLVGDELCSWRVARLRFLARLSALDAQIGGAT